MKEEKIAIIGAGPAGIFSALLLKNFPGEIHLFEENHQIGKKLKLTGNGKMNVANKIFGEENFFSNESRILKNFFKNPLTKNPEKIFDEMGIEYFWKENRAILKNENAKEEVENLQKILENRKNIFLHFGEKISDVITSCDSNVVIQSNDTENKLNKIKYSGDKSFDKNLNGNISLDCHVASSSQGQKQNFLINGKIFDKIILASGGMLKIGKQEKKSEIYSVPEKLGHKITKTEPSLSPLIIKENPFSELSGTPFFGEISDEKNLKNKISGDILFTHKGLSGPAILDFTANEISDEIKINFFPETSFCHSREGGNLENLFLEIFLKNKETKEKSKEKIGDFIKKFSEKNIPNKLINFILEKILKENSFGDKIFDTKISDISKKNFLEIRKNFFHLKIKNSQKMDYKFCRTTKGGISLKEININNLESKIHKNLFFAGEILDINGLCGGYNISFAAICAKIISEEILREKNLI